MLRLDVDIGGHEIELGSISNLPDIILILLFGCHWIEVWNCCGIIPSDIEGWCSELGDVVSSLVQFQ
jgi:hypothetical protein